MGRARDEAWDVIIVGAGIMGLAIAYNLKLRAPAQRVLVLEGSYLCSGASGRNGGGVRAQWSSQANIELMQQSLQLFREFARRHRINTWLRQSGYVFLARGQERAEQLAANVALQAGLGLSTRLLGPQALSRLLPLMDFSGVTAASHNPEDCVVFPWPFVWGYAESAKAKGVELRTFTRVQAIQTLAGRVCGVETQAGFIRAPVVVAATGALSPELVRTVGLELPTVPERHEICSTEPLKPWLLPLVADLSNGLYFSQSTRGELVGGVGAAGAPKGDQMASSWQFLARYSRALTRLCPKLGAVRILRQWAGLYDLSPDHNPIVGEVDEVPGLFLSSGFMGHGFMMAPAVGQQLAESLARGSSSEVLERWNLRRFRHGAKLSENMIIG